MAQHSANKAVTSTGDTKGNNLDQVKEEIRILDFGAQYAGTTPSTERIKGDSASDRSSESVGVLELGNRTNVHAVKDAY